MSYSNSSIEVDMVGRSSSRSQKVEIPQRLKLAQIKHNQQVEPQQQLEHRVARFNKSETNLIVVICGEDADESKPQLPRRHKFKTDKQPFGKTPFESEKDIEETKEPELAQEIRSRKHEFGKLSFSLENLNRKRTELFAPTMDEKLILLLREHAYLALRGCTQEKQKAVHLNEIWILDGMRTQHFRYNILKPIADKYSRLGITLNHYHLPELYIDSSNEQVLPVKQQEQPEESAE